MSDAGEQTQRSPETEKTLENIFLSLKEKDYELASNTLNTLPDEILHTDHRASYFLAKAIILSKNDTKKEIEYLEKFLTYDLYNVNLLCRLGHKYFLIGERQKAIDYTKKAMLIFPEKKIVQRIAKKVGLIKKQKPAKSIKKQKSEFRKESSQLSTQAFRELQSQNIDQAIEHFKKAVQMNYGNVHAIEGLIAIANNFSQQQHTRQYKESIKCILIFIKNLEKIEHIIKIIDDSYKLNNEKVNKIVNEKAEWLISQDIENCLKIAKYFVNRRVQIARQYLRIYKQKTNTEVSFNSLYCYDKIEKLIEENAENCLKFAKYYISKNRSVRIAQYCLEKYANKIKEKDKIYFELMLQVLQIIKDYDFTELVYKEAKKAQMNVALLNKYSAFLESINRKQKKEIRSSSIWEYLGGLRPVDIVAARVISRQKPT